MPMKSGSTGLPRNFPSRTPSGPPSVHNRANRRSIRPGRKRAQVSGIKTTAPRSPMDRKPKSLMVAEGTTQAMTAEAASTARMVPRVATRAAAAESKRLETFL